MGAPDDLSRSEKPFAGPERHPNRVTQQKATHPWAQEDGEMVGLEMVAGVSLEAIDRLDGRN